MYTVGGFTLPFFIVGSISLALGVSLCLVIPEAKADPTIEVNGNTKEDHKKVDNKKIGFFTILKVYRFIT